MIEIGGNLEPEAAARNESPTQGSPAASKIITSTTKEVTDDRGKVILSRFPLTGHLLEWLIHLVAIGISIGICLLHFKKVYWTDESTLSKKWRWLSRVSLDLNDVIKALQFAAKAHEILMVASIGAIVLYFARRRLVRDEGIALGLLMSSFDTPANILSSKLWLALGFDASWKTIVFSLLLLFSAILSQLVGPASAGVMQPSLDWWNASDPYNGHILPLHLSVRNGGTYPLALNETNWPLETYDPNSNKFVLENATECLVAASSNLWCPAYGFEAVETWIESNYEDHATPNITVTGTGGTQRTLTADLIANGTAIAATHSNWVIRMFGLFALYVKHHSNLTASNFALPMYTSTDPIYAPVVQVQCHAVVATETAAVSFLTDQLTNYTDSGADRYNPQMSWPVPHEAFVLRNELDAVQFTWVDFSKTQDGQQQTTNMWRPSLGAVAKIPGWVNGEKSFYAIPCIIDARWAASSATYQPIISDIVLSNLSSPAALANSTDSTSTSPKPKPKAISGQQLGIGDAIQIGLNWADALNPLGYYFAQTQNLTSIEAMLDTYVRYIENNDTSYAAFTVGINNNTYLNDTAQLMQAAANTTATILSLTIADGLSRLSDGSWNMVVLDTKNGNVTWTAIDFDFYSTNSSEASFMKQFTSIRVQVSRYGWAYGWSAVIILDVIVLFMHISMVILYAGFHLLYVLCFWDKWWLTDTWNNAAEFIILARNSSRTEVSRNAEKTKSSLWAQNIKVRETSGGDAMELVAGGPNTVPDVRLLKTGTKYI
ncbi:hypothetical protein A0O28_0007860 [Trichoderma guizhouense]|uniref:Uncharacterized protein n=1 Tax=Trichoderma guizhouense TaxID=1491466 RepID=A0A1T3CHX0_9HYPO|nr:hypothetical protein A0O28_0007860 [Trichoderma guizhouense]